MYHGQSTVHVEQTWTNVENDKSFGSVWQGIDKDHRVVPQDDGRTGLSPGRSA